MGFATSSGMIETIQWNEPPVTPEKPKKPVFQMVSHDRTAGSMPMWGQAKTPTQHVEQTLSSVQEFGSVEPYGSAYQTTESETDIEEFTFGDLIDMANPLHHIPLVNLAYREITGDTIKPIGNIVGGAIFGGGLGAAAGVVSAIIQVETGKDIGDHAVAMVKHGERPSFKSRTAHTPTSIKERADILQWNNPDTKPHNDMSLALLSFGDLKQDQPILKNQKAPVYNS